MIVTDIPTLVEDIEIASKFLKDMKAKYRGNRHHDRLPGAEALPCMSSEDGKRFYRVRRLVTWLLIIRAASRNQPRQHLPSPLPMTEMASVARIWQDEYKMEI